jgi:hypothetical protein
VMIARSCHHGMCRTVRIVSAYWRGISASSRAGSTTLSITLAAFSFFVAVGGRPERYSHVDGHSISSVHRSPRFFRRDSG